MRNAPKGRRQCPFSLGMLLGVVFRVIIGSTGFPSRLAAAGDGPAALVAKHRYGAKATWSYMTDTASANFTYAEACAFKFNLALTVFDSPFSTTRAVTLTQKKE